MTSAEDSDDEPLSVLAESKAKTTEKVDKIIKKKKQKISFKRKKLRKAKRADLKALIESKLNEVTVVERPPDVWLYFKDMNPTGPYSCLLCPEWFINKTKMVLHYIVDHKKDFCGICRYFVPDRDHWYRHRELHSPWSCPQCNDAFETEPLLKSHFSSKHKLIHCRLCHFMVSDNELYDRHLSQAHNVKRTECKDNEFFWELYSEGVTKFKCLLCNKSDIPASNFANHYIAVHHFSLKCFSNLLSGRDVPFTVSGCKLTTNFAETELKQHGRYGYVAFNNLPPEILQEDYQTFANVFIPMIKHEITSDHEEKSDDDSKTDSIPLDDITYTYQGEVDFDITLTEIIIIRYCNYKYCDTILESIANNSVPENSTVNYEETKPDSLIDLNCPLCNFSYDNIKDFNMHLNKMHCIKTVPFYSCRVCTAGFDNLEDLEMHVNEETADFEDLWICQFCEKEFDDREATRRHLKEHIHEITQDNCFSPHLGFKCRYCPTLFWNEPDREMHTNEIHFQEKITEDFYKCIPCGVIFNDKVWFTHHYLDQHKEEIDSKPSVLIKCLVCHIVMTTITDTREHFTKEHPLARKIYCSLDKCVYRPLAQRKSFKFHLKSIHRKNRGPSVYNCPVCSREFSSKRACGTHLSQAHERPRFKCRICVESLHTNDERKLHYLLRHPGRHPFECTLCHRSFPNKSGFYSHRAQHMNQTTYTCSYCDKIFMKKDSYREHIQIHTGPRHNCSYCPMSFVQRSNLLRHERRHTGERPYSCQFCQRAFADKGACNSHMRTHSDQRAFRCMYCGQTFAQKTKLNYHIRKHTGENLETCEVCSKTFTSTTSLREHMKTHCKGTTPCPLCDRKYADQRSLLRHVRTSHHNQMLECPLCRKQLTTITALKYHIITHSENKTYRCKLCPRSFAIKKSLLQHLTQRHPKHVKGKEVNMRQFYRVADARDCGLGLDEDTIMRLFGPRRESIASTSDNYVNTQPDNDNVTEEEDNVESEKNVNFPTEQVDVKIEEISEEETQLEPTDFVTVKIEPIEEEEMDGG